MLRSISRLWERTFPSACGSVVVHLLVAILFTYPIADAIAQAPDVRDALERYRGSLATINDTSALIEVEQQLLRVARANRDSARLHLELGIVALRLGEVGGTSHYEDAASEFEWAAELEPSWPYPLSGLGEAELGIGRRMGSLRFGVAATLGNDGFTKAREAYVGALERERGFLPALRGLAEATKQDPLRRGGTGAVQAFRLASATRAASSKLYQLLRGRLERDHGDLDSALAAFSLYRDLGGDEGWALLELARIRFLRGDLGGEDLYYQAAAGDEPELVGEYRRDLGHIGSEEALSEFDRRTGSDRAEFLRRFWRERDLIGLRKPGERLAEHYRRLWFARNNFRRGPFKHTPDMCQRLHLDSTEFDHRGVLYVRHGEPVTRQVHLLGADSISGTFPNRSLNADTEPDFTIQGMPRGVGSGTFGAETWVYHLGEREFVFHLESLGGPNDFRIDESPLCLQVPSREEFLLRYAPKLLTAQISGQMVDVNLRERTKQDLARVSSVDSYELRFERPLKAIAQIVTAGSDGSRTFLHVAYGIRVGDLTPTPTADGLLYPVEIRVAVIDSSGTVATRVDSTVHSFTKRTPAPGATLLGHFAIPIRPGSYTVRMAMMHDRAGGLFPEESIVAGATRAELTMSDVVIGVRESLSWISPAGDTLFFNPSRTLAPGDVIELYYEVFGLQAKREYDTEIEVTRKGDGILRDVFGGRDQAIRLYFKEIAMSSVAHTRRAIGLQGVRAGEYELVVRVTTHSGRTVERRHPFFVQQPEEESPREP